MVLIPHGSFTRAKSAGDTIYTITLTKDFYICDHEVTQAEYQAVMGTNPSNFIGDNLPVEKVSWYDALVYCNKKSLADGLTPCYSVSGVTDWAALRPALAASTVAPVCRLVCGLRDQFFLQFQNLL